MPNNVFSKEDEIRTLGVSRPHVVILGAGASRATCPNGDKNGRKLPVMADLIDTLNLTDMLAQAGVEYSGRNFEKIYSELYLDERHVELRQKLEASVAEYFGEIELPPYPTIYDYLLLSLRSKDVIATFNWDPLLFQAYNRNSHVAEMPTVLYLHGCCCIAYCPTHQIQDVLDETCPFCDKDLTPSPLLFPVANKNYASDPYLANQWEELQLSLKHAFILTIFGYGAPQTDVAAVQLMRDAWGDPQQRFLERIEIIDILDNKELARRWKPFIHTHHYSTETTFFDSFLSRHPRRTCDAVSLTVRYGFFREGNPFPELSCLEDLWRWLQPLVSVEEQRANCKTAEILVSDTDKGHDDVKNID